MKLSTLLLTAILLFPAVALSSEGGAAAPADVATEIIAIDDLLAKGSHPEAISRASALLKANPALLAAHIAYQDARRGAGDGPALLAEYDERARIPEATADDFFLLARLQDERKSLATYRKALKLDPDHFATLCALGAELVTREQFRPAREALEHAMEVAPSSATPVNSLGWLAERTGEPEEALALYRKAAQLDPRHVPCRVNLGILLVGSGRPAEALVPLEEACRLAPRDPLPLLGLGMLRASEGDAEGAVGFYRQALELEEHTVASLNLIGTAQMSLGEGDLARRAFERALAMDEDNLSSLLNLAYLDLGEGKMREAEIWCRRALRIDSGSARAWYFLGLLKDADGEPRSAEKSYRKALRLDPTEADYARALGVFYSGQGRWSDAVRAYEEAAELSGRDSRNLMDLAFAWSGAGQPRQAVKILEEIVQADSKNLDAWMTLGLIYQEEIEDERQAIHAYEEYLAQGGTDERVTKWLKELRGR